jgi:hypothetical protein
MKTIWSGRRLAWIAVGVVIGFAVSHYWPQKPAIGAYASTHSDSFSMCTATTGIGMADAVFVLDPAVGRLIGAVYGRGGFNTVYGRNLAADFKVTNDAKYVMVPASVGAGIGGAGPAAEGAIFVAEQKSGKVIMYGFPASTGQHELVPVATFPWRGR